MAKSLMDGISSGPARSSAPKASGNAFKLTLAISLFVVAMGLLAWYSGLFESTPKPPPVSAEQTQEIQKREAENQQKVKTGQVQSAGSN
jgi:hypothetical protein